MTCWPVEVALWAWDLSAHWMRQWAVAARHPVSGAGCSAGSARGAAIAADGISGAAASCRASKGGGGRCRGGSGRAREKTTTSATAQQTGTSQIVEWHPEGRTRSRRRREGGGGHRDGAWKGTRRGRMQDGLVEGGEQREAGYPCDIDVSVRCVRKASIQCRALFLTKTPGGSSTNDTRQCCGGSKSCSCRWHSGRRPRWWPLSQIHPRATSHDAERGWTETADGKIRGDSWLAHADA